MQCPGDQPALEHERSLIVLLADLSAEMSCLSAIPRAVTSPTSPRSARRQHTGCVCRKLACQALGSMEATKGNIAIVADSSPAKSAGTATEILAAALSELLSEAKRHTALLEALVGRPAQAAAPPTATGPAAPPKQGAAPPAVAAPVASLKSHKGGKSGSASSSSHVCFSVEELRARARAHNHLLDIDSPKSRAILALLRTDGTVPDHFPVRQCISCPTYEVLSALCCWKSISSLCIPSSLWVLHAWLACGLADGMT
jgi:hypothetical protein